MPLDLSDLPDELQGGETLDQLSGEPMSAEARQASELAKLDEIGSLIAGKRDAAVKARKESGIEDAWTSCEEAYARLDEMNRGDGSGSQPWRKPTSANGPLTRDTSRTPEARSTVYVPLTTRYVDMAAAKVKEKALPIGGKPFEIKPSPTPDLVDIVDAGQGEQPMAQAAPNPGTAQPAQMTPAAQAAKQQMAEAAKKADKASDRIWDWLERAKYNKHLRKIIDDAARIGCGILKGPFPDGATEKALSSDPAKKSVVLEIVEKTFPGCGWVDPWNFFPAGNCGEDIHEGDHVLERKFMSEGKLNGLKSLHEPGGLPVYLPGQIDKVIDEGPDRCNYDENGNRKQQPVGQKGMYTVWVFTGQVTRKDMIALRALGVEDLPEELVYCHAVIELVNDTVIRAQFNPLAKTGNFPYRVFNWSRRVGHWAGVGVGEQVAVPQRMVNAGVRAWMNNAGVSSGVQLIVDRYKLIPADGSMTIGGGIKVWETTAEGMGVDVRTLMAAIAIPNLGAELKAIVDFAFQMAEEMSNIPLVSQGRDGPTTPQTFGQAELQNTNSNSLLRSVADTLDGDVIEPFIDDCYEWLLLDDSVPDDEKGDFQIVARGCSAMVEKSIQEQALMMFAQMSANPIYGLSPDRVMAMVARSKRIDPQEIELTDAEKQQRASQPPPEAPAVTVAKINAGTAVHVQDMRNQSVLDQVQAEAAHEQQLLQSGGTTPHMATATARIEAERIRAQSNEAIQASRAQAEQAYADTEAQIARDNAAARHQEILDKRELAILEYSLKNNQTLEQVKAALAQTAMQEQTKRMLAGVDAALTRSEGSADRTHDMAKHVSTVQNDAAMQQAEAQAAQQGVPETQ